MKLFLGTVNEVTKRKVVVITGATSGIGKVAAENCAAFLLIHNRFCACRVIKLPQRRSGAHGEWPLYADVKRHRRRDGPTWADASGLQGPRRHRHDGHRHILYSDNVLPVNYQEPIAVATTLPTAITLGNTNFAQGSW
jgi:hypothetical protein